MFNPLHSSTNQELFESASAIKIATMTNMDDFRYEGKPSCTIAKLTLFTVSKDEWDTKEDTGKSMKKALHILRYAKRHILGRSNIKIKPLAAAVIKVCLSENFSQSVSRKFC